MPRKILFFINPVSGGGNRLRLEKKIIKRCTEKKIGFEILPTDKNGNYSFLEEKIYKGALTDVVICGGDGTLSPIISSIQNSNVNIGIIPTGSGNGLAFTAKIPRAANKALDIIFKGKTKMTDAFYVNGQFSCMLCGIGLDAQVALDFSLQKKRGLTTYIRQTFKNFLSAKTYLFEIKNRQLSFTSDAFFLCIANSNQFGNHFTIAPKAKLNDGLLDIIIVKKMSKPSVIWSVLKQIKTGKVRGYEEENFQNKSVVYFQTDKLQIINHHLAPVHIDGDVAETKKIFDIEILPSAFRLIVP